MVTILNFSDRINGNCAAVAEAIEHLYNRENVMIVRVSDHFKPCSGCDYECLRNGSRCPAVDREMDAIMEAICTCDITYYVIPNFCGVPCANYYAFNERSVGWFDGSKVKMDRYLSANKRFVFITNSMPDAFQDVIKHQCTGAAEVLQLASRKYSKRSSDGDILDSEIAVDELTQFVRASDR